ncbi:MAG TPA: MBL fold metallo-hydrolase [Xanthobacteraceae bacterium]|jgi:glyoxylase-like metal-dependent hydrolase (beta-lactamase superfamily II)
MKPGWLLLAGLATAAWSTSGYAQTMDFGKIEIVTEQLAPNLHMLTGSSGIDPGHEDAAGGRVGVLAGPDGILMVDSQYAQLTDKVLAAVRRISSGPIRYLVNTHIHRDHTAGNASFAKMGAVIFAREELREGMVRLSKAPNAAGNPVANPVGFPVVTYGMGPPVKIHMNDEIVDLIPIRAAHTGGDTNVKFEKANVIFIGDFYRNYGYPFIDINNGGSLKGMLDGLDLTMKSADANTTLVPGHGTTIKRDDIVPYRAMIVAVAEKVQQLIGQGKSLQEVLAAKVTAPYDARTAGGTDESAVRFVTEVYQEIKAGK